jgi:hypothetical protein
MMIATPRTPLLIMGEEGVVADANCTRADPTKEVALFHHGERNPDLGPVVERLECRSPTGGQLAVVHERSIANHVRPPRTKAPLPPRTAAGLFSSIRPSTAPRSGRRRPRRTEPRFPTALARPPGWRRFLRTRGYLTPRSAHIECLATTGNGSDRSPKEGDARPNVFTFPGLPALETEALLGILTPNINRWGHDPQHKHKLVREDLRCQQREPSP